MSERFAVIECEGEPEVGIVNVFIFDEEEQAVELAKEKMAKFNAWLSAYMTWSQADFEYRQGKRELHTVPPRPPNGPPSGVFWVFRCRDNEAGEEIWPGPAESP